MIKRPEPRQQVILQAPEIGRLGARVEEADETHITLALFTDADSQVELADVTVEFTSPRGLLRLRGRARKAKHDTVRLDIEGEAELSQRRGYARVDAVRPVSVMLGDEIDGISTYTLNLSENGVLLAGPDTLAVGDTVWLSLRLLEGAPAVEAQARVVRDTNEGFKGVEIERIAPRDRELIVRFVFDRQRHARQMTRDG